MKRPSLRLMLGLVAGIVCTLMVACGITRVTGPTPQQLTQAEQVLNDLKSAATAATQPIVVRPATDTQPAITMPAPKELVDAGKKAIPIIEGLEKGTKTMRETGSVEMGIGDVLMTFGPLAGAAGGWVVAGGALLKMLGALRASRSQAKAVQAGIDAKVITVNKGAAALVDNHVADHPTTDGLIDVLAAAAGDPIIHR